MLKESVFDGKKTRSQFLGTGMTRKRGTGMTLKEWELMAKRNTGVIQRLFLSFQCVTLESRKLKFYE